jgi:hypothetical protein
MKISKVAIIKKNSFDLATSKEENRVIGIVESNFPIFYKKRSIFCKDQFLINIKVMISQKICPLPGNLSFLIQ